MSDEIVLDGSQGEGGGQILRSSLALSMATGKPFAFILEGGTHNPASPCLDFLERAYLTCLKRMGVEAKITVERRGFYPAGGGKWKVEVTPPPVLQRLELLERGGFVSQKARVIWSKIPPGVAERESAHLKSRLGWEDGRIGIEEAKDSIGPGNVVLLELRYENITEVVTSFGAFGVPSETVVDEAVRECREYQEHGAPVGEHLADQLLLPMALGAGGVFRTAPLTSHSRTNIETIGRFLPRPIEVLQREGSTVEVRVG